MLKRNFFSLLVTVVIAYLSLANASTFKNTPFSGIPNFDKFVHFSMYFTLMSAIILEHRSSFRNDLRLFLAGLIPLFYGVLLEFVQAYFTTSRSGSFFDALADLTGIVFSIILWILIRKRLRLHVK